MIRDGKGVVVRMQIETPAGTYRVIQVLRDDLQRFSCLAAGEGEEKCFLVQAFREPAVAKRLICCLVNPQKEEIPGADVFVKEGNLWVVTRYYSGTPFSEKAAQTECLEEKLQLWDGALREIFFRGLPVYMQYEAVSHLVVDDGLIVHADGLFAEPEKSGENLFPEIQRMLSEKFLCLFARREKDKDGAAAAYGKRLREAEFADGVSVYREFRALSQILREQESAGVTEPEKYLVRWWKKLFTHVDGAVKYVYWLAVAALWGVFFAICLRPATAPDERYLIPAIGTVGIRGYELPEEGIRPETEFAPGENIETEQKGETESESDTNAQTEAEPEEGTETETSGGAEMG